MKRILVVNVNWLGDVIFSSPVFSSLRTAYPDAHLACLCVPRVREIAEHIPAVDQVIVYDEDGQDRGLWAKIQLIRKIRRENFDAVFFLHRSRSRAYLMKWANIPIRVGYDHKNRKRWLTHVVPQLEGDCHRSDFYLNVIESYGVPVNDRSNCLQPDSQSEIRIQDILREHDVKKDAELILIHTGGNWDLKRWPERNFRILIEELQQLKNLRVILTGGKGDVSRIQELIQELNVSPLVLAGHINLSEMIALCHRAGLMISSDSGPLHIANSVGTDVLGIFGPTRPEITGPRGSGIHRILFENVGCNHKACYHLKCQDNICMQAISVKKVLDNVKAIQSS